MNNDIVVFDFETGSSNPYTCQPLQLAACVLNRRTLEQYPNSEFSSLIKPSDVDKLDKKAMEINRLNIDELQSAPSLEAVWNRFTTFVNRWNKKKTIFSAPIAAGHNITKFDMVIVNRLCELYGPIKDEQQSLFHPRDVFDTMHMLILWFEGNSELSSFRLDAIRKYFGMTGDSVDKAHNAIQDVKDTSALLRRFLKLHRNMFTKVKFKDSFAKSTTIN